LSKVCEYTTNFSAASVEFREINPTFTKACGVQRVVRAEIGWPRAGLLVYRKVMSISRSGLALFAISLLMTGAVPAREAAAQPATPQAQPVHQAPPATNLPAQSLKLIPMPREVSAGAVQSLAGGVQINCAAAWPRTASPSTT
jgi:hypothetical protein